MAETPELTEDEFRQKLTEEAKNAIKGYCVDEDGTVTDNARMAAIETAYDNELLDQYPLSVIEYRPDNAGFTADSRDYLTSIESMYEHLLFRCLAEALEQRITSLLDGEWDKI